MTSIVVSLIRIHKSLNMTKHYFLHIKLLKGHFDETLGGDFFLFSETAFIEMYTSKISGQAAKAEKSEKMTSQQTAVHNLKTGSNQWRP